MTWFLIFQYHTLVSVALIMVIISIIKLESGKKTPTTSNLIKIGITLLILAWVLLVVWTFLTWRSKSVERMAPGFADGTRVCSFILSS